MRTLGARRHGRATALHYPGRALRRRLRLLCDRIVDMDEFRTSQVCSKCAFGEDAKESKEDDENVLLYDVRAPRHAVKPDGAERRPRPRLKERRKRPRAEGKEEKKPAERECKEVASCRSYEPHGVRFCPNCHTTWNRDVNAARNILHLFLDALRGPPKGPPRRSFFNRNDVAAARALVAKGADATPAKVRKRRAAPGTRTKPLGPKIQKRRRGAAHDGNCLQIPHSFNAGGRPEKD